MVHKTSTPASSDPADSADKPARLFQVWKDASLAIFPGIPNHNPYAESSGGNRGGIRGKVLTLSEASRRNLMIYLAKIMRDAQAYTMALTLPGDVQFLTSAKVHLAFKKLCNRQTASRLFPSVSLVWKRELQRRGALHYHLVIYGLDHEETRLAFHNWIADQWNALVCVGLSDEEKGKHLRWHRHTKNMEKVRGNIARYFAKYLGKPLETAYEAIPGRWWGKVNAKALPLSACSELRLPERAAIIAHRIARKLLKKRANEGWHRKIANASGMVDSKGQPLISQFGLIGLRDRIRKLNFQTLTWENAAPGVRRDVILFSTPSLKGLKWGKAKRSKFTRFSRLRLISNQSPATALQIMQFVGSAFQDWIASNPF